VPGWTVFFLGGALESAYIAGFVFSSFVCGSFASVKIFNGLACGNLLLQRLSCFLKVFATLSKLIRVRDFLLTAFFKLVGFRLQTFASRDVGEVCSYLSPSDGRIEGLFDFVDRVFQLLTGIITFAYGIFESFSTTGFDGLFLQFHNAILRIFEVLRAISLHAISGILSVVVPLVECPRRGQFLFALSFYSVCCLTPSSGPSSCIRRHVARNCTEQAENNGVFHMAVE